MPEPRALVIDDSNLFRLVLRSALERAGFAVDQASGGTEALDLLQRGAVPDVVVVDWNMPDINGVDLVRHLRANPILARLRIIMVTSESSQANIQHALSQGVDRYLTKPVQESDLHQALRSLGFPIAC